MLRLFPLPLLLLLLFLPARDEQPAEHVTVTGDLFGSSAVALKIGSLTAAPIRDVLFEYCEVFDSNRAMAIETRHPVGMVERVVWRDIRAELVTDREGEGDALLQVRRVEGGGALHLQDCLIERVQAKVMLPSLLTGTLSVRLTGLRLVDVELDTGASGNGDPPIVFELHHVEGINAVNLAVHWNGHQSIWTGTVRGDGTFVIPP